MVSDNGNGNGLKHAASDFSNVFRSPRGHNSSSKCPKYDPYIGKPLEPYPPTLKEPEDVHNSSGGIISHSNLVNLVPHNSARKSQKVQDENIIPTYLFEETENGTKTTPVKDEGEDVLKKTKLLFDKKVKKMKILMHCQTKEEGVQHLKDKLLEENCCLLRNPELGSDSFFVAVAHFIPECDDLEPVDKAVHLRLRLTQWISTNGMLFMEVS